MATKPLRKVYVDLLVMVIGFAVLAYLFRFPWLCIGSGIAALAAIHPVSARAVSKLWERVGKFLGKINSSILLGIFFVCFISPFALLYRLTKRKDKRTGNWQALDDAQVDFNKPY